LKTAKSIVSIVRRPSMPIQHYRHSWLASGAMGATPLAAHRQQSTQRRAERLAASRRTDRPDQSTGCY